MGKITIAIDGFSSCGKSTMAKELAKEIGYVYVDSGAMYRAVTLYCLNEGLLIDGEINSSVLEKNIHKIQVLFKLREDTALPETYLNGVNVEAQIRKMQVSNNVSLVSALAFVRKAMVNLQQKMGNEKGIVMDGRDIGTVVFPQAELKVFVTADTNIRAQRRYDELRAKGDMKTSFAEVLENIKQRDYLDQTREESPLVKANDAIVLDNSHMTREEQMAWLLDLYNQKFQENK